MKHRAFAAAILLASCASAPAHVIPDDVTVQAFVKPEGNSVRLLVRVPFDALADIIFPLKPGSELDLPAVDPMLPGAATRWISDWIDFYEGERRLPKPVLASARVSLRSDPSFASYEAALAHIRSPVFPAAAHISPDQAMLDVLFEYPIQSERSKFAIESRLARLGGRVATVLRYISPAGAVRTYEYRDNPGLIRFDPPWYRTVQRFAPLGFFQLWRGSDYWLFLICLALLFRSFTSIVPFTMAFTLAHSATLLAAAYHLVPEPLWFPVLFQTLLALSILYMAIENIASSSPTPYRWMAGVSLGLLYGLGLSSALRQSLQFGGVSSFPSVLSYLAGVELGQLLIFALLISVLSFLFRHGVPRRLTSIFLGVVIAHTSWHRMIDRALWLSNSELQWPAIDPAIYPTVLRGLIGLVIVVGLVYGAIILRARHRTAA